MPRLRVETHFGVQARTERIREIRSKRLKTIRAVLSLRLMSLWLSVWKSLSRRFVKYMIT